MQETDHPSLVNMPFTIVLPVIYGIIFVFNVTGNVLVIYIIMKKQRTSTDYLLLNLAVADLLLGIFVALFFVCHFCAFLVPSSRQVILENQLFCRFFSSGDIASVAFVDSTFTMLILSVERYFAVCRPHSFTKWFAKRNVKLTILLCWPLSFLMIVPKNDTKRCLSWDSGDSAKMVSIISVAFSMFTLIVLVALSVKIYVSLWCRHTLIHPTAFKEIQERKKKKKVTLCVLAVAVTYIVFSLPQFITFVLTAFESIQRTIVLQIPIILAFVNSSLDPYLFSFQSQRMRKMFKKIFLCKTAIDQR